MKKLIVIFFVLISQYGYNQCTTLIDSYTGAMSAEQTLSSTWPYAGQTFTNTNAITLTCAAFKLIRTGSPTGNAVLKIYAHTGTYGSTGKPTGSALATSDNYNVATIPTSQTEITFTFSGANQISLSASTYYVVVIYYSSTDGSNYINIAYKGSNVASGNMVDSRNASTWYAYSTQDCYFKVWGNTPAATGDVNWFGTEF